MKYHVGTSGFSYKEWKGKFYPSDIKPGDMLSYYAEHLSAVEINNTFYRMPRADLLKRWAQAVPDNFRFVIKAPRRITHSKKLVDVDSEVEHLLKMVKSMKERLGALLFQLPPWVQKDHELLAKFLQLIPTTVRVAIEFRHRTWQDDEIDGLLRERNVARVMADTEEKPLAELRETADWAYVRLRRCDYDGDALTEWRLRFEQSEWQQAFVFFKHEDEAAGPKMATDFVQLGADAAT